MAREPGKRNFGMTNIEQRSSDRNNSSHKASFWLVLRSLGNARAQHIGSIVRRFTPPWFEGFDLSGQSIGTFETRADAALALQNIPDECES